MPNLLINSALSSTENSTAHSATMVTFSMFTIFNKFSRYGLKVLTILLTTCIVSFAANAIDNYRLDTGDTISITVFGQDDLSKQTLISDSGKMTYPFLGEINVRGLTEIELEHLIHKGLEGDYLVNPNVSVAIVKYRPFFIAGEVKKAGGYPYQPGLTIGKSIALAGGLTERASLDKIYIIRANDKSQTPTLVKLNTPIGPGDIISIKQSFF
ncbi:polysaccharide biosynthesis/export family protein [Colwelliaceae bacterium BS250]